MNASRVAVISWLGGTVSVLPFAQEWFDVGEQAANFALLTAIASAVALGFAIHFSGRLRRLIASLAGPPQPRARALVLVAAFAGAGFAAMVGAAALVGSL